MNGQLTPTPVMRAIQGLVLCLGLQPICWAQPDFEIFKITGAEGFVGTTGQSNATSSSISDSSGTSISTQNSGQNDVRLETSLTTHSYIYHPKLLSLDVGLGLVGASGHADSDGVGSSNRDSLYNLNVQARILSDKPARGTVFYEHLNNSPSVSSGEIFNQTSTRYGLTATVVAPLSPVALDLAATREHNQGSSVNRSVDDKVDRFNLRAERSLPNNGRTQFSLGLVQQDSANASAGSPLQSSHQDLKNLSLDTRLKLGSNGSSFELNNRIEYSKQQYTQALGATPEVNDLRFTLDYNATPSSQWRTYANYQFGRNRQDQRSTLIDSANAWTNWTPIKDLDLSAGLHLNDAKSEQFSSHAQGVDGSIAYAMALPLGTGQASYSVRYEQRDQIANGSLVPIVGEHAVLNGTAPVPLSRTRVTGSSVQVRNINRTQTYIEGIDYVLSVVGISTRLQRLLTGLILDGEEVLIDYEFDVGGTFASTQLDQGLNLNWAVSPMLNLYLRYSDSAPTLRSGAPTSPLNSVQTRLIGARADVPLSSRIELMVGGVLEHENHRETISPFVRSSGEFYLQGAIPLETRNNYRFGLRHSLVSAENLLQDSDLVGYDLLLGLHFNTGLSLNATALYERDRGGISFRERKTAGIKALWRYRRLSFSADLSRTQESQDRYVREITLGRFDLRRDF